MHVLAVVLALLAPPVPPERAPEPEPEPGLVCYWLCMGACIALGNRQDRCDAVCTDSCFTIVLASAGPEFEFEPVCV